MTDQPQTPQPTNQAPAPLPPLTRGQKIKYSVIAIIVVAAIGGLIAWSVTSSNKEDARVNTIKDTGIRTTGTANGEAYEFTERSRRGGASTSYKAKYDYTYINEDRDGREEEATAIGEKVYDTKEEVEALKGQTVDLYYDDNGGTFVEDDK
jgi:hypothetical protein